RLPAIVKGGFIFSVIGGLAVILAGYGYQWGWWHFSTGFRTLIPYGTGLAILGGLTAFVAYLRMQSRARISALPAFMGLTIALCAIANAAFWHIETQMGYPPIHDISTDTENPPPFDAIVPLREGAPNPAEYAGEETAEKQAEFYPDIQTYYISSPYSEAFDLALETAESMPWQIVDSDKNEGRIEAFHKIPWFGFIDDVVIRVDTTDAGSKIDVRSKSRIGRGDLGVNAKRIRKYLDKL
ncbi:MAG: DUF1499 domain-containing protein, partial [Balneolaceae bacterium]